jgi:isocitrate/isopropylmalate dehydrogenase
MHRWKDTYFEPVHGSASKYANQNVINPTAMILSAKMMLEYFEMEAEAKALEPWQRFIGKGTYQGIKEACDDNGF